MELTEHDQFLATRAALENLVDAVDLYRGKHSVVEGMSDQSTPEQRHEQWAAYVSMLTTCDNAKFLTRPKIPYALELEDD